MPARLVTDLTHDTAHHHERPKDTAAGRHRSRWVEPRRHAARFDPPALSTVVVVPHPDDEVLLFGGLIQLQQQRGLNVHVIAITDGDAAIDSIDKRRLAEIRRDEQTLALAALGVSADHVERLAIPDGSVSDHEGTITNAIVRHQPGIIVAPWTHDHHCDHEAAGRAALQASAVTGSALYFGLFWTWQHTDPTLLTHQRMIRLPLSDAVRAGRRRAIAHHRSQVTDELAPALLGDDELEPLDWADEYYITNVEPLTRLRGPRGAPSLVRPGRGLEH